jgi:hypothetical protein
VRNLPLEEAGQPGEVCARSLGHEVAAKESMRLSREMGGAREAATSPRGIQRAPLLISYGRPGR